MKKSILALSLLVILAIVGCKSNSTKNQKIADDLKKISFSGTEPFWNIVFQDDFAIFTSPEEQSGVKIYYKQSKGDNENVKLNEAITKVSDAEFNLSGIINGVNVQITIKKETCNNGMSEEVFPYSMTFVRDGNTFQGCGK